MMTVMCSGTPLKKWSYGLGDWTGPRASRRAQWTPGSHRHAKKKYAYEFFCGPINLK
jgi:hypothetical protein